MNWFKKVDKAPPAPPMTWEEIQEEMENLKAVDTPIAFSREFVVGLVEEISRLREIIKKTTGR